MGAWQLLLEFTKTVGLGSLLGVLVGVAATHRQKKSEVLQGIKSANYREIVAEYRSLSVQLLKIKDAGRSVVVVAQTQLGILSEVNPSGRVEVTEHFKSRLNEKFENYLSAQKGLEDRIASMFVHRSETDFYAHVTAIGIRITRLENSLDFLNLEVSASTVERAMEVYDHLDEAIDLLGLAWDQWKVEAEHEAAGLRPAPRFFQFLPFINRRL